MHDERLHAGEPLHGERGDVPVPAELAQQRLGVPEHQVRRVRPRQLGVPGVERPAVRGAAAGRLPGQLGGLGQLRAADAVRPLAEQPAQRAVGGPLPGGQQLRGAGLLPHRRHGALDQPGEKLKNVATTTCAGTAPIAAAREPK